MFSEGINKIKASFVRNIIKLISQKDIISFAGGLPNPKFFPKRELKKISQKIFQAEKLSFSALQYGESAGYYPLRKIIAQKYWEQDRVKVKPEEIIITTGSQQAMDLISKIFINKNDIVLVEEPTFLAAFQIFDSYQAKIKNFQDFTKIKNKEKIKFFYTIPNFQNPTGLCWDNQNRKKIADWAKRNKIILVEDDPYGEIRFSGPRPKPLLYYNKNCLSMGSFSKILVPGFRIGWVVAKNKDIYQKLILAKQTVDLHSSNFSQVMIAEYYLNYDNKKQIKKMTDYYQKQKNLMIKNIKKYFPEAKYTLPDGGLFIWLTFPVEINTNELIKYAVREKVAFVPGSAFYYTQKNNNSLRLNYSNPSSLEINEGFVRLAMAYQKYKNKLK